MQITVNVAKFDSDIHVTSDCLKANLLEKRIVDTDIDVGVYPNLVINGDPELENRVTILETNGLKRFDELPSLP